MKRLAWLCVLAILVVLGCPGPRPDASVVPITAANQEAGPTTAQPAGNRVPIVAIEDVLKHVGRYAGQRIRVHGMASSYNMHVEITDGDIANASVGRAACTRLECGAGHPCCNSCNGPVSIITPGPNDIVHSRGINLVGEGLACSGNECSLACTPGEGTKLDVTGELRVRGGTDGVEGVIELVVEKVDPR